MAELTWEDKVIYGKDMVMAMRADVKLSAWLVRFFAYCQKNNVDDYENQVMDIFTIGVSETFIDDICKMFEKCGEEMVITSDTIYKNMVSKFDEMCKALNQDDSIYNLPTHKQLIAQAMIKAGERMLTNAGRG